MKNRVISIIGLSKNAGKTSFLNWFIKNNSEKKIGVTTTGRDGEEVDLVHNNAKPKVKLPSGVYFTNLNDSVFSCQIVHKLYQRVIGKNLWLYKSLENIETEIIGSPYLFEQEKIIDLFKEFNCEIIIIDGSIDRKSICLSDKITEVVLVIGASAGNIKEISFLANNILLYTKIPVFNCSSHENIMYELNNEIIYRFFDTINGYESYIRDIINSHPNWIYFPGALTDLSYNKIKSSIKNYKGKLIFEHPFNVKINSFELEKLINKNMLFSRLSFPLKLIAVNSFSDKNEFIDAPLLKNTIQNIFSNIPVVDICELQQI